MRCVGCGLGRRLACLFDLSLMRIQIIFSPLYSYAVSLSVCVFYMVMVGLFLCTCVVLLVTVLECLALSLFLFLHESAKYWYMRCVFLVYSVSLPKFLLHDTGLYLFL